MATSSVRVSLWLSTHVIFTLSPLAPPLNLNDRNGFFATAGPHCASSTTLSLCVTLTFWMNHAGIVLPCASLRWPVSICLLYTSDAADERSSVDLGGRRIIKKKNETKTSYPI